jgi:acyl phosphate:glycerol-3-phosphate acyltransferase
MTHDVPMIRTVLSIVSAYLLGAVPFGFLIARARGIDIRAVGSGNIGATNVFRAVGKGWGVLTFVCDVLKGLAAVALLPRLVGCNAETGGTILPVLCGAAAVAGHNWPVYLRFKGGKGVATSAGVLLGLAPAAVGIGLAAWIAVFAVLRYVSLASMLAAAAAAAAAWWLRGDGALFVPAALTALAVLTVVRHRDNIRRLRQGTEHRFGRKGTP